MCSLCNNYRKCDIIVLVLMCACIHVGYSDACGIHVVVITYMMLRMHWYIMTQAFCLFVTLSNMCTITK